MWICAPLETHSRNVFDNCIEQRDRDMRIESTKRSILIAIFRNGCRVHIYFANKMKISISDQFH